MTTVYLHIGTPKTGTTAIQYFMGNNEEALNKQGYSYPYLDLGMDYSDFKYRSGHFLAYTPKEQQRRVVNGEGIRQRGFRILGDIAKKYPNIILSDEVLWYRCNFIPNFWKEIVDELAKINCQLKVVVYLRRQDQVIQSLWNQTIKGSSHFHEEFMESIDTKHFRYFPLEYYKHLNKIAAGIGEENLLVRVYERGQFKDNDILADFMETVGLKLTEDFSRVDVPTNYGLTGNFIEIKKTINSIPQYQEMRNFMSFPVIYASVFQEKENQIPKTSMFNSEEVKEYMAGYEECNRLVAQKYLGQEDGVLFREPLKEQFVWEINEQTMSRDVLIYAAEMFCSQQKKIDELRKEVDEMKRKMDLISNNVLVRVIRRLEKWIKGK